MSGHGVGGMLAFSNKQSTVVSFKNDLPLQVEHMAYMGNMYTHVIQLGP